MKTLIPILIFSLLLAWLTERTTIGRFGEQKHQSGTNTLLFALLVTLLALPIGLRTAFNDTGAYINGFRNQVSLYELFMSDELHLLGNPGFAVYTSLIRDITDNYHIYFLIPAFFVQFSFLSTIRRYSSSFTLGVGIYICLGTYVFSFAAMKQVIAMAVAMLGIPKLLEKKYLQYYLVVFLAFLFHTYAIAFAVLPLFIAKPWSKRTLLFLATVFFVMGNFESVIGAFLDYANEQGKAVAEYEVFDNAQVNLFRVAVYAVVPLMSLVFKPWLFKGEKEEKEEKHYLLIHMSIISVAFMLLGTISGANMFGRMATYFEFGIICSVSYILRRTFERRSAWVVSMIACVCFFAYFYYAYAVALVFDDHYRAITILEFFQSLFAI